MTTTIPQRELDNNAGKILDRVEREHEDFVVTRHGRPMARLMPIEATDEERLAQMELTGQLTRAVPQGSLGEIERVDLPGSSEDWIRQDRGKE
ncbi:MAG: type II toxin-antitoxin system Phd/YefM family antitoxin [Candidatus Nanopelagicales bacterium]|nr:type II toxin-antitoxin system Phd/YefM family antitoxin [Candidatus Nanopelagicales bacterium]MDZ4249793.1 type II toxin-antitoxin system Phd/YefM family antitoxin [Candidatus Nanopelagicales bacterium]MDZ7577203.1 type II toxin-antitoxin system Phd/YefM family antitoxin [Candidatus Nanopelagicales bacterium]